MKFSFKALAVFALSMSLSRSNACEVHEDCAPLGEEDCLFGDCTQYCDQGQNCFPACQCEDWQDAIDGECPPTDNCVEIATCDTHSVCPLANDEICLYEDCSQYCDETNRCFPACECDHWEDSIDGTCPEVSSCDLNWGECETHDDCEMGEYCDDTFRCWGLCDCFWYGDAVDEECPADEEVETFCASLAEEDEDEPEEGVIEAIVEGRASNCSHMCPGVFPYGCVTTHEWGFCDASGGCSYVDMSDDESFCNFLDGEGQVVMGQDEDGDN